MRTRKSTRIAAASGVVLTSLAWCTFVSALDPSKSIPQYVHEVWEIEDGLPQNSVNDMEQDARGYLWLATLEGLVRFDGVSFTVFNKANTEAIVGNEMRSFHRDGDDVLWVASYGGGLIRLEDDRFTSYGREDGLTDTRVWEVSGSDGAGVWLATHDGLFHYDGESFRRYGPEDGLAGDDVRCVHVDEDGTVWAGTMNGLSRFDGHGFRTFTTRDGLGHDKVKRIARDRGGRLWVGTHTGLSVLEDGRFTTFTTADGLVHESVIGIFEDRSGALWLGTEGGVSRLHDGSFSSFTTEQGLSQDIVRSFFEDAEGSLWVGTETGGLNRFRDGKFVPYTRHTGLPVDLVWSFLELSDGSLAIGSADGLVIRKEGTFTLYPRESGDSNNMVSATLEDSNGTFWVGTNGDGLFVFRDGEYRSFPGREALEADFILSLEEDGDGTLWIGTRAGLRRLRDGEVTFYSTADGLAGDVVRHIEAVEDGSLWIGTGTGLSHLQDGRFTNYTTEDGLSSDAVFSIHRDVDGTLWLGTYGGGLNRYRDGVFHHATTREGLFDDVVYVILDDGAGNLWMSGNKGVFRVRKTEFDDLVTGRLDIVLSPSYGVSDGMKSPECNGGLKGAGCRTSSGRMWFPTIRGAVSIDPDRIPHNEVAPPVHVERLIADGEEVSSTVPIELPPGVGKLEFHYTALSFAGPQKVLFEYMLEGYDTEWVGAGTRRVAYYTNLPHGEYVFRVRACNNDGVWNEAGASLVFRLMPHVYETPWFIALASLSVVGVLLGAYRRRIHRLERREQELEALVELRTRELREASLRDSLTGLRNRRFVTEIIRPETEIFAERKQYLHENGGPRPSHPVDNHLGIFLVDIDHFKAVNDSLGHEAGDRVLRQFAEILTGAMRKDDIVVRWGGEEFLVVLKHTAYGFIETFAGRILDLVSKHEFVVADHSGQTVRKTCSVGYVPFPFHPDDADRITFEQTIMLADLGLYHSKRNGRNRATGVLPTGVHAAPEQVTAMLASLEYGIDNGLVRLSRPAPPARSNARKPA